MKALSATSASVSALQRIFGLTDNGTVNESTWLLINYIYAAIENGCLPTDSAENAVAAGKIIVNEPEVRISDLKELMRINGINVGSGPIFGLRSRRELKRWQSENGLNPTGLPDRETRLKLSEARR